MSELGDKIRALPYPYHRIDATGANVHTRTIKAAAALADAALADAAPAVRVKPLEWVQHPRKLDIWRDSLIERPEGV